MSTLTLPHDLCQQTHPILSVSALAHSADSDDSEPVWTQRVRIDRRHGSARWLATMSNGFAFVALCGGPEMLNVDDAELTAEALAAAELWRRHVRTYRPQRRPLLPVGCVGFPRDGERRKSARHCDRELAA